MTNLPHYTQAHRQRKAKSEAWTARQNRTVKPLDTDPAVKLYRKEKKRAVKRGAHVLTSTRQPPVDAVPKRDMRAWNAEYYEKNRAQIRAAQNALKEKRRRAKELAEQ